MPPKRKKHIEGGSLLSDLADRITFKKRAEGKLPPKSRNLLAKIQNEPITSIKIVRTPIESYINRTLQLVSGGSWRDAIKNTGYDTLFHLSLFINNKYVYHKIETTTLAEENPIKPESQTMDVKVPNNLTIGQLVDNTKKQMGDFRYTNYDPATENCQDFVMAALTANGMSTPENQKFVKQDAVAIFEKTPKWTSKFAKFVTDIGARANRLLQGESINNKIHKNKKSGKYSNMSADLVKVNLHLTHPQFKKLKKGHHAQIAHHQLGEGKHFVLVHPHKAQKIYKAHRAGKGHRLHLSPEEFEHTAHAGGFLDFLKSIGNMVMTGFKPILKVAKPLAKAAAPIIAPAISKYTGLPISSEMVSGTADVVGNLAGVGIRGRGHSHPKASHHESALQKFVVESMTQPRIGGPAGFTALPAPATGDGIDRAQIHHYSHYYPNDHSHMVKPHYSAVHHPKHHYGHGGSFRLA